jgi:D-amino-acid dehydrogenase
MRVLVLGGGVVGVTAAWYLAADGHEVTLVDRQPGPALETSFANGGQISAAHAEPWANPRAPITIARWLGREDAPLLFRLRADLAQWRFGLAFLRECFPRRYRANVRELVNLARYSRDCLQALRNETGIEYDHVARGILEFHTEDAAFEAARQAAESLRAYDVDRVAKTAGECVDLEPALATVPGLVGGILTPGDESGDAHAFTVKLAMLAQAKGVRYCWNTTAVAIETEAGQVSRIRCTRDRKTRRLKADAYVVALGSGSPKLLKPLGVHCPIYPVKGYSATFAVGSHRGAPSMSLTDPVHKLVFSRLGGRLRVAGTAELAGWNTELNRVRCERLVQRTFELFPDAGERESVRFWAGLRPATPSNVPLVGATRYPNLFLDTGHGTLGWTMACGSGRAVADIVAGRPPACDFCFLTPR